ncbi:hypothetical protein TNCV_858481 [Trichonephila clavipes]|nr:hypothetical protein TNCV_858481 [Trichonephila clavipes]
MILKNIAIRFLGENNSTRPLNSKAKTIAGEKQLDSAPGTKQLDLTGGNNSTCQKERNNSTRQDKPTQLASRNETTQLCPAVDRLHRLYSRIGFFYLLTSQKKQLKMMRSLLRGSFDVLK